jgi:hypothetical protein
MSKTTFSDKCRILGDFWFDYREDMDKDENWKQFFDFADMGLPLAFLSDRGYASVSDGDGVAIIEETWITFCGMCDVDPEGQYLTVSDIFDASPQPVLE